MPTHIVAYRTSLFRGGEVDSAHESKSAAARRKKGMRSTTSSEECTLYFWLMNPGVVSRMNRDILSAILHALADFLRFCQ